MPCSSASLGGAPPPRVAARLSTASCVTHRQAGRQAGAKCERARVCGVARHTSQAGGACNAYHAQTLGTSCGTAGCCKKCGHRPGCCKKCGHLAHTSDGPCTSKTSSHNRCGESRADINKTRRSPSQP
eukprot:359101-Chlamydomonas_euryale.AAC.5